MSLIKTRYSIEYHPRKVDSQEESSEKSLAERPSSSIFSNIQKWTGTGLDNADQIYIKKISERKVIENDIEKIEKTEEIIPTGINKKDISWENLLSVTKFLNDATDQISSKLNQEQIKTLSKLILEFPDKLIFFKRLLESPKSLELLSAFSENSGLLTGLDSEILNKIIGLEDSISVIEELGRYPLWRLDRNFLNEILNKPYPGESLWILNQEFSESFLEKIYQTKEPGKIIRILKQYPEILKNEKLLEKMDKIFSFSEADEILDILGKNPELLKNEQFMDGFFNNILEFTSPKRTLFILAKYPELLKNEKLITGFLYGIFPKNYTDSVLESLGKYPVLNKILINGLLDKILKLPDNGLILNTLGQYPELLQDLLEKNLLDKILFLSRPNEVLDILAENQDVLKHKDLTPERWNEILSSSWPHLTLVTLTQPKIRPIDTIRNICMAIIDSDGKIDVTEVQKIRQQFDQLEQTSITDIRHKAHIIYILDLLEKSPNFRTLLEKVNKPGDFEGSETVKSYIRIMLNLKSDEEITHVDAKRAVLEAVFSDLRQGNVGSCFGTAIAIMVHDCLPQLMIQDLTSILEKGYFTRKQKIKGKEVEERFYIGENLAISNEIDNKARSMLNFFELITQLRNKFPEYANIFTNANIEKFLNLNPNLIYEFKDNPTVFFDKLLKNYFEITDKDFEKENALLALSNEIHTLSVEQSLTNDENLNVKIQSLIDEYEEKSHQLGEKRFLIIQYRDLSKKIKSILYVMDADISLLAKGWEYGIMSAELRQIEEKTDREYSKHYMQDHFQAALFNKEQGEIILKELDNAKNNIPKISLEKQNSIQTFLDNWVTIMKTVLKEKITIKTIVDKEGSEVSHYLMYAMGEKDIGKFKVLTSEEECSQVIVSCIMEAFEKVISEDRDIMDKEVKDYLLNLKGILGDRLASKEFKESIKSLLSHTVKIRAQIKKFSRDRIGPIYFEQLYNEKHYNFTIPNISDIGDAEQIKIKMQRINSLSTFILLSQYLYKSKQNKNPSIKYPIGILKHSCNLIPFNPTMQEIVQSNEEISAYLNRLIRNTEKKVIALMDSNWNNSCYLGFEIGNGNIRIVKMNAQFEIVGPADIWENNFGYILFSTSLAMTIDKTISNFKDF
ncbi:MAG: hypothetical protein C5B43_03400 [Verrucomicrobia bacterium]|nr:MAG: hypothetical protein C5B43_03400 [Verrucomicrobiota bacterium]